MFTVTFSTMWTVYARRAYARHDYYLRPEQKSDAGRLSVISRSCCIMAIATGKISVAFLIQRIQGPSKWRLWFLRFCSVSVFITGLFAVIFLFAQCQPARALWTPSMIKNGTGHCWDPIPVNNYDIVIAGYFTFLDFALAVMPIPMIWKLKMATKKKLLLCVLLGMGIFAGVCAAIKTSQLRTVTKKVDITYTLAGYLLWNALEVNVIIIAACVPTLRPLFLVVFKQAGAEAYLKKSYQMSPKSNSGNRWRGGRSANVTESVQSINGKSKDVPLVHVTERPESEGGDSSRDGNKTRDGPHRQSHEENLQATEASKVAVLGAAGGIGQPLSLLMKLNPRVTELGLYDIKGGPGVAADIGHINTKSIVTGYQPDADGLRKCLTGAEIVLIPAGVPRKPGMTRDDLFNTNASIVRDLAKAVADSAPDANVLVISNP
ncbi:MAG: hypothetical protein Q9193_003697, partial [Seirophora villosa]